MSGGLRCSYCGAPLDVGPDSVVVVCKYCGKPNLVAADADVGEVAMVPTLRGDAVAKKAVEAAKRELRLKLRLKRAVFGDPDLFYVPYYFVEVSLRAWYTAKVRVTYTRIVGGARGARTEVVTRNVSVSGEVSYADTIPVLARRAAGGAAAEKLARHYLSTRPNAVGLEQGVDYGISKAFMAAEFGRAKAKAVALREAVDEMLKEVEEDAKRRAKRAVGHPEASASVVDKAVDFEVEKAEAPRLIYLPIWLVPYVIDESQYYFAVAGWDGALLASTEPVFLEQRMAYIAGTALAAGLLGGIGGALLPKSLIIGSAFLLLGAAAAYYVGSKSTRAFVVRA